MNSISSATVGMAVPSSVPLASNNAGNQVDKPANKTEEMAASDKEATPIIRNLEPKQIVQKVNALKQDFYSSATQPNDGSKGTLLNVSV
ncbi:hypothetical protein [Vibrio owensii]|uniref:hypothetical protein n=1 Tax=Vibrio owensii TaxID=696485 RepID=UPI003CC69EC6